MKVVYTPKYNPFQDLTAGKSYEVIRYSFGGLHQRGRNVVIINDAGKRVSYQAIHFTTLEEIRQNKLDELL